MAELTRGEGRSIWDYVEARLDRTGETSRRVLDMLRSPFDSPLQCILLQDDTQQPEMRIRRVRVMQRERESLLLCVWCLALDVGGKFGHFALSLVVALR